MPSLKTITVTHQNAINYGAVLQAYALQQQLFMLGVEDELLDLERSHKIFNKVKLDKHLPGNIYSNMLNLWHVLKTKKRIQRFKGFVEKNIKTTRHYETFEAVIKDPPVADAYITGSDQTFNTYSGVKPASFLRFGSEKTKRISYASSMGISAVKDEYLDEFTAAIKAYRFLSVREKSAADYISKLCSVSCSTNIDPTLLLSNQEWSKLASSSGLARRPGPPKYIVVYQLLENPLLNDAAMKIKKETGLKIVSINPYAMCRAKSDLIVRDAGPLEFLDLFKNAEYILTTSFHGTCFSLIFQKKFFSFIRKTGETRITNILNKMGLGDRIVTDMSQLKFDEISYDQANAIIETDRKKANDYLIRALSL